MLHTCTLRVAIAQKVSQLDYTSKNQRPKNKRQKNKRQKNFKFYIFIADDRRLLFTISENWYLRLYGEYHTQSIKISLIKFKIYII